MLVLARLCSLMEEQLNVQLPPGTTECNHSYYTRNSFSASHSVLQLQNDETANSVQPLTHTQQANGAASSGSVSSPPLPCSTISSQVPVSPIRNVTGDVMPLAQAITQLSFLEFLQHCGVPLAPPQPSQLPVPISLLDAVVQTNPPGDVFQDVSTQTSDQYYSSLSLDVAVQTSSHGIHILSLDAAVQTTSPSTPFQHVSTQMGSRLASSFSVDVSVQTPVRSVVLHDVAIKLPITQFFVGCVFSNDPLDRQNLVRQSPASAQDDIGSDLSSLTCTITRPNLGCVDFVGKLAPRALLQPPPGLEQLAPPSGLATGSHLHTTHGAAISDAPPRARLRSAISVIPPEPSACSTHVGSHHLRSATTGKRSASTALVGTHNLANTDACAGSVPLPKPRALVLPLVHFGQSKPEGYSGLDTAGDLMHHEFRLSLLQWNPGLARRNPTNIVSAACGKFHAVILQEASDHVPHISDYFRAYTDNTDLAILLNKDTFEPEPIVNSFKAGSTSKGTWGMILLIVRGFLRRPSITGSPTVTFCSVHIHNVVAKERDASTDLLQRLHGYMEEYNVDFRRRILSAWQLTSMGTWCTGGAASRMCRFSHHAKTTLRVACPFTWLLQV